MRQRIKFVCNNSTVSATLGLGERCWTEMKIKPTFTVNSFYLLQDPKLPLISGQAWCWGIQEQLPGQCVSIWQKYLERPFSAEIMLTHQCGNQSGGTGTALPMWDTMGRDWKGDSQTGRDKGFAAWVIMLTGPHPCTQTGNTWGNSGYKEHNYLTDLLKGLDSDKGIYSTMIYYIEGTE